MIAGIMQRHRKALGLAYGLTVAGFVVGQLYPLATAFAINGVLAQNYPAILWLVGCHFLLMTLEVSAKMLDTRIFTRIHSEFATDAVHQAHRQGIAPTRVAGRAVLLREYISFLESDVPAALLSVVSVAVSMVALIWLGPVTGLVCLLLLIPASLINMELAKRSRPLHARLNDRLEKEVEWLQRDSMWGMRRHFRALSALRVRLSDLEAGAYGLLELFVIALFAVALWRISLQDAIEVGTVYAIFSYIWRFVTSMDVVPQIVQQLGKLADISRRLKV